MKSGVMECGYQVYSDYVDDDRNTDVSWVEKSVVNYHCDDGSFLDKFLLAYQQNSKDVSSIRSLALHPVGF